MLSSDRKISPYESRVDDSSTRSNQLRALPIYSCVQDFKRSRSKQPLRIEQRTSNQWLVHIPDSIASSCRFFYQTGHSLNERDALREFYRNEAKASNFEHLCRKYLDERTFVRQVTLKSGEQCDALELYALEGSHTIQQLLDDCHDPDMICLRQPGPALLPIVISRISNETDSYIVPSDTLDTRAILAPGTSYELEAVVCELHRRKMVFMKNSSTEKWYYYQDEFTCDALSDSLSEALSTITETRSRDRQKRLIDSAHFLLALIFYNAKKYIYKKAT